MSLALFGVELFPPFNYGGPITVTYFEQDLVSYLSGAGLVAYAGKIPQGVNPPAFTFTCLHDDSRSTIRRAAGLTARVYQVSAFSTDYLETIAMEAALRAVLLNFRGFMGTTFVSSCRLLDMYDLPYEENVDGSDEGTYHRASEYRIFLKESIPTF